MKIAKVSSVSLTDNKKTRENKSPRTKNLTSFGKSSVTDSVTSQKAANAIKSNFLSNVSFKGQALTFRESSAGTSGQVNLAVGNDDSRYYYKREEGEIPSIQRNALYRETSSIEKTNNNYTTNRVYFADPEEFVNDQTKRDHDYIVYDNYVDFPSLAEVSENYFNTEVDAKNFGQTFKNIAEFHYRREIADKRELNKLQKEKESIQRDYDLSLNYKNTIDDKMNKFPWQVDTINKDKEKADYFYAINKEKLNDINQKIGYYTGRITYSQHRQEFAIQAFGIFDEVGLMFMDRDNIRHGIEHIKGDIQYSNDVINYQTKKLNELNENKNSTEEEMKALSTLIRVNNKKISTINKELESNNNYNRYSLKSNKEMLEEENKKLTYKITNLNEQLEKLNKGIDECQKYIKESETRIANAQENIPKLQERFEQKAKEIQSYYNKMQDFYKQNIEG